ncbi:ligase-associated DNA damage response endonuclease PdeM [Glaciecola petra]|uniref:Ligase-associated DNA damage response endonuclease PdeM n=1 Tax=Glaciecola petra TaxID=3075602 RepID=A0ABU2ZU95_9ALTE|nr:ligase-associated DNA damage response endonuclease PdeM [Aestuariibacter sp. P117]MDT0596217.1 ligase-associated DNA damage response endonuclease PdeM [Aestuariibacter sp. P117]
MLSAEALKELIQQHKVIPIHFGTQSLLLAADGVLIWPRYDAIIFSDLHLEKGSFLSQFSNPIPRLDSRNTLTRIQNCLERYACKWVICLGDSLHDGNAVNRMEDTDLSSLNELVNTTHRWTWVQGNHDPDIPKVVLGERSANIQLDGLLLTHEPENLALFDDICAQIVGHFHPKLTIKLANRKVNGKSFLLDDKILIMPAFGKYTGGLDSDDLAFKALVNDKLRSRYLMHGASIYKI